MTPWLIASVSPALAIALRLSRPAMRRRQFLEFCKNFSGRITRQQQQTTRQPPGYPRPSPVCPPLVCPVRPACPHGANPSRASSLVSHAHACTARPPRKVKPLPFVQNKTPCYLRGVLLVGEGVTFSFSARAFHRGRTRINRLA